MADSPGAPAPALALIDLSGLVVADLEGRPDSVLVRALRRRLAEDDEPGIARVHYQRVLE